MHQRERHQKRTACIKLDIIVEVPTHNKSIRIELYEMSSFFTGLSYKPYESFV